MLPFLFPNPLDTAVMHRVTGSVVAVAQGVGTATTTVYPPPATYDIEVNQHQAEYVLLNRNGT